ncbi:zinc ribbon domain-containing protein [Halalkalicoccus subterraneus]|uniref:zinc ribbon domain-containing protein n=1 Tax=Halalkalicoccus subterraneus TaxID=2675002 RepID=UPI000EFC22B2|nr:zinc ribbon domain-containing protein [Halalkalicoccus subterraneus]
MSGESHKRPWFAAFLAIAVPGLGHVYLRAWFRALLWFWMVVLSFVLFVPEGLVDGVNSFGDALALSADLPFEAQLALFVVIGFSAADAYWQASQERQRVEGHRCPHCGREVDDLELDFCHWCTEPLDPEAEPEGPDLTSR